MAGVRMSGTSKSEISYDLEHEPSGTKIFTMAPVDNGGDGSSFSPTDLCAVSLGACASTVMGLYAKKKGFSFAVSFEIVKEMQQAPRRIASLHLVYFITSNCDALEFEALKAAARACPVRKSLHPDIVVIEEFQRKS